MKNKYIKIFYFLVLYLFLLQSEKQNANAIGISFSNATYTYGTTTEIFPVSCGCVLPVPVSGTLTFEVYAYGDIMDFLELSADPLPTGAVFPTVSGILFVHSTFTWSLAHVDTMPVVAGFKITPFSPPWCYISFDFQMPVELSSFSSTVYENDVTLNWTTASEINNSGFDIERKLRTDETSGWIVSGSLPGNGNSNLQNNYTFTDLNLNSGKYQYRLKQTDFNGSYEYYYLSNDVNIGMPVKFGLEQNYPNPFNPSTKFDYQIPDNGNVSISLYDNSGKEVMKLVNEYKTAGYYTFSLNASKLTSVIYFCRITAKNMTDVKKMMLVK